MRWRLLLCLLLQLPLAAAAQPLDFLHWWTAGSEARTLAELRRTALAAGVRWQESPVAGAANASTLLKTRFLSGNPPALAQLDKAVAVWGEAVPLADLTPVAEVGPRLPNTIACTFTAVPRSSGMRFSLR